jgi:hypothetical protein
MYVYSAALTQWRVVLQSVHQASLRLLPTHVNSTPRALKLVQVQLCATLMLTSFEDVSTLA